MGGRPSPYTLVECLWRQGREHRGLNALLGQVSPKKDQVPQKTCELGN